MNPRIDERRLQVVKRFHVGVELSGDLQPPLSVDERQLLRDMLDEFGVLVFRNQHLTLDEQCHVMSSIGPIPHPDGKGYVSVDPKDGILGTSELVFHSDSSWSPAAYLASSLLALDVVDGASSTLFASNKKALASLPPDLRARLENMRITEVHPFNKGLQTRLEEDTLPGALQCTRSAIQIQSSTGIPYLYVTRMCAKRVEGLTDEDSRTFLEALFKYMYTPANVYEHIWHNNDLVIWDNLTMQHARGNVANVGRRYLQRVGCAHASFEETHPKIYSNPDYAKWLNAPDGHPDEAVLADVFRKAAADSELSQSEVGSVTKPRARQQ